MALKNTINLNNITQQELNCVKEIASNHVTMSKKLEQYSNQVQDPQFKQLLKQSSKDAETTAMNLTNSL
ncbi:hypothetical protein [Wansuia hejianensis]|uniref:Uncharacterized protein n=1 Tax=Wansuia hejianensis TaxID=2763667 RepID=A0A926ILU3_9FIRM|nr:hypothetical protein [Wansuia hejianensis]MBC8589740.1 hypothetical protein [Wansuia hejianensis]